MARASTENFAEMTVEIETSGGDLPPPMVNASSVSNAATASVTVGTDDIDLFQGGDAITVAGGVGAFTVINGAQTVGTVDTAAGSFTLTGVDTSAGASPQTTGVTVQPAGAGDVLVWEKVCGLTSRTVSRTNTMQTTEVPDCDDETLPASIERAVQSSEVTLQGTGVWAAQSHGFMMDWWYAGAVKNIRVANVKAPNGTPIYEEGPAYLVQLNNTAQRGQKVTSEIQIQFDGIPNRVLAPALP
jgi:hypothetical protein